MEVLGSNPASKLVAQYVIAGFHYDIGENCPHLGY
jgi:hypothetical protein